MMDSSPRLRVLACGGTFDKRYDPLTGALTFIESQLPDIMARARVTLPLVVETVMLIDSLDMQPEDRERVLAACRAAPESALVIVHGTDTMPETARALGPHFGPQSGSSSGPHAGQGNNDKPDENADDTADEADDDAANEPGAHETHDRSKTIVLTGAMVPYAIARSDALFNLGFACACAQTLAPGVWVAINGRVFAWDRVRKNREAGVFEATC